jgi:phage virion morphogenesis protein
MKMTVVPDINLANINRVQSNLRSGIPHVLDGIGLIATASVIKNFEAEGRPEKWADLKQVTKDKKTGNMILHESGMLKGGIMHEVDSVDNAVFVGPSGPATVYARIHDRGGKAGRGKSVEIKQRRYLFLQDEDRECISDIVREQVF